MVRPKITLYFDTVSPFAYLAFYALREFPIFKQCDITFVPVFLGGLMKICENKAPIYIKNKDKWIDTERDRWRRLFNIPMAQGIPPGFPQLTLTAQRALVALSISNPSAVAPAAAAIYNALWVQHKQIQETSVVASILEDAVGSQEAAGLIKAAQTPEIKAKLNQNTEMAFEDGAFGLPWFVATNSKGEKEGFWGFDHLGQVIDHLELERPAAGGWRALL